MKELRTERISIWEQNEDVYLKTYFYSGVTGKENEILKPAVIICPGGGYLCISEIESDPVADRFAEAGYQPFVLNYSIMEQARYREGEPFKPVLELAEALKLVRQNAEQWSVDGNKIIVIGFSAGGHLAATYCADENKKFLKPVALILSYPLIDYKYLNRSWSSGMGDSQIDLYQLATRKVFGKVHPSEEQMNAFDVKNHISVQMPQTFICHALNDTIIEVESSIRLEKKFKHLDIPCKLYLFEKGVHGEPFFDDSWFELAMKWLKGIGNE